MALKIPDWAPIAAAANKALAAKKGKLPIEAPSVSKAMQNALTMHQAFNKARDQFAQLVVKYDEALEGFRLASAAYRKKLEGDDYNLDDSVPEEKKLMQATDAALLKVLETYVAFTKERQEALEKAVDAMNHLNKYR